MDPVVAEQVDYIVSAFGERGIPIGVVTADRGVSYMYAEGHLVVREEHLERVQRMLPCPATAERITGGIMLVRMSEDASGEQPSVADLLPRIDAELGEGVATPNQVLTAAGEMRPCPATEPQEVYDGIEPSPSVDVGDGGAGVLIFVADTGLLDGAATTAPWLAGVEGDPDPLPKPLPDGTQPIPPYAGHGTFVAGVARCMAPRADIFVANIFSVAGSALETDFVRKLDAALNLGVDIFNLSIVAPTRNDVPLQAFRAWLKRARQYKGVVCVVAAGNSGSRLPQWPAAFPETVSVGALAADWRSRADFSDYGGWVDVYAPGRGLINAYATGTYTCRVAPYVGQQRKFYGMARWSGTSFSTPIVTGLIAARMSRTGENGRQAAEALLAEARAQAIPGVGAVLLPPRPRR
ncbi:MAG TPA: S8/S53 family peptidase [Streptosporangiaceae bacterium]|nr:S8/S53 family peptidase [Streptosporangiaceae bacterium]